MFMFGIVKTESFPYERKYSDKLYWFIIDFEIQTLDLYLFLKMNFIVNS